VDRNGLPILSSSSLSSSLPNHSNDDDDSNPSNSGGTSSQGPHVVDEALADIVLVRKQDMEEWRRKQEQLKHELAVNKRKVELKLKETKQKYERQYQEIERQKDLDIRDLEKRYEDLRRQKELQDRQNLEAMKKMEANHLAAVEDLEAVYERKLYVECGSFLKLEQEKLERKKHYEACIGELKSQNQRAVDRLLNEFKSNMVKVEGEYVDSRKTSKHLKDIYDKQIEQVENKHEDEIVEIK
jgi:hypothetical protein